MLRAMPRGPPPRAAGAAPPRGSQPRLPYRSTRGRHQVGRTRGRARPSAAPAPVSRLAPVSTGSGCVASTSSVMDAPSRDPASLGRKGYGRPSVRTSLRGRPGAAPSAEQASQAGQRTPTVDPGAPPLEVVDGGRQRGPQLLGRVARRSHARRRARRRPGRRQRREDAEPEPRAQARSRNPPIATGTSGTRPAAASQAAPGGDRPGPSRLAWRPLLREDDQAAAAAQHRSGVGEVVADARPASPWAGWGPSRVEGAAAAATTSGPSSARPRTRPAAVRRRARRAGGGTGRSSPGGVRPPRRREPRARARREGVVQAPTRAGASRPGRSRAGRPAGRTRRAGPGAPTGG